MTRNGQDDAAGGISEARAIEGLLAYALTSPRWGGGAVQKVREAVARSRVLAKRFPGEYTDLLAHSLLTAARIQLNRGRAIEALPLVQEAVALARVTGGDRLIASLHRLAEALEELHRYSEAAAALAEADQLPPPSG
ncbi:hypothetical protein [Nonomuraea jiangxiensis]|uniref:Tetratricopeptide repeat-containing protein n=1 Tax=Nonomuraea jiangxiensis TaxID=633440 RepID=A0A1G8CBJ5_9ACTN|nr:hypothetical protein [Nonomuraea jiangxiensis]SDH42768.1 hypothetical protein SAMN05421869_102248 [Nonomuraea jiangxiensis]